MNVYALLLTLACACMMALHATSQKWILSKKILSKREILVAQNLASMPIFAALVLISVFAWNQPVRFDRVFWIAVFGTTIANFGIQFANVKARELADASLSAPINATTPGLVAITAIILGEVPGTLGIMGIALIMAGTWVHSLENARSFKEYFRPFKLFFLPSDFGQKSATEQEVLLKNRSALRWALLSATLGTGGLICDALVSRHGNVAIGFACQTLTLSLLFGLTLKEKPGGVAETSPKRRLKWKVVLGAVFGLHIAFIAFAFTLAPVAHVGSIKRFSIIFSMIAFYLILKEKKAKRRLWPAAIIVSGGILIASDDPLKSVINLID